ncbi:MAG: Crp/Fnr family transcriptional regulator [Gammaproteobacteria bacterium]|nr:MAG: Crp/Fnr family transcriptional regulator [Gammaproteobacteria bacterium]
MSVTAKAVLRQNLLLRGLAETSLDRIAGIAVRRSYVSGATIFRQGDPGDALFAVIAGQVRVSCQDETGREVFLNILESGDVFGEIAVIDGAPRTATAVAVQETAVFLVPRSALLVQLQRDPALSLHMLQILCQRLRWVSDLVEEGAFLDVSARLASRLLKLGHSHGKVEPQGMTLRISQGDLANFLSASRQVVNEHLQAWRDKDWVSLARGTVVIRDADALAAVARRDELAADAGRNPRRRPQD